MKLFFLMLFLISCSSHKKVGHGPQCYLYLGQEAVKVETQGNEVYIFSRFEGNGIFYWEQLNFIERQYLPVECSPQIVKEARERLSSGN